MGLHYFSQDLTIFGTITNVNAANASFTVAVRSGDLFEVHVGPTTYYQVVTNLDNIARDRVPAPSGREKPGDDTGAEAVQYALLKYAQTGRAVFVAGIFQQHNDHTRFEGRGITLLHSNPGRYVFEETHWWLVQTSQMADRILDHLFDARRNYTIDDFSKFYRTQLNILGQPIDDTVQECAVMSRLLYDLSSAYLLTGSERYFLAARAATDYLRQSFRSLSHDGEYCFWAYGRRRLQEGEKGESLLVPSQGPDDVGTLPLYEQIYALAGLVQYYRITLDWEVLEDVRRTLNSFLDFYHDSPQATSKGFPGKGGYFSHLDPVTMRPDSDSLGANRLQKNWNSIGDHIPAYLVNLILTLDPLPQGDARARQTFERVMDICTEILDETASLIVERFPDAASDYVNERFTADWQPVHDYRWQRNRAVVGHNLKIAWNLTRVTHYYRSRARRLADQGLPQKAKHYSDRAEASLKVARDIGSNMAKLGLDQVRGGVFDCVERSPSNSMPTQFAWRSTKDFWQQEQGILAYLILYGATQDVEYLSYARECQSFWNAFFLDHERQGYFFRVTDNGLPLIEGEFGRKGGHAIGYHAFELAYLAHVYTRIFVSADGEGDRDLCLYFKVLPNPSQTSINVLPDFMPPGKLQIVRIRANGIDVTADRRPSNPQDFQISLQGLPGDPKSNMIDLAIDFRPLASAV